MKQLYRVNSQRMQNRISELAEIGKQTRGGVTRKALTEEDRKAQLLVTKWMEEAGMTVKQDHFGNIIGRIAGTNPATPAVVIGSHIDTVPNGGNFDGTIGVIGGIEVAQIISEESITINHPLEVIAFLDEEGTRFDGGLFGSRGMVGKLTEADLLKKDGQGISRLEAMQEFGLDPSLMMESVRKREDMKVFLELHIEQGPYLQAINQPVGIVKGIAGPAWLSVTVKGESGHAGTVPMKLRKDPMAGAAEMISEIERICSRQDDAPTVGTIGKINALPGGTNVIPEQVEFSLDIRDIDLTRRDACMKEIKEKIELICHKRGLTFHICEHLVQEPIACAGHVIDTMKHASKLLSVEAPIMISGAGHDAMMVADLTDIGLIL